MKAFFRRVLARLGYELRHRDSDPILTLLDRARDDLRLHPVSPARWQHALSQLALSAHIRNLLVLHRPDLVVDVGANRGQFALHMRELGYTGPIFSLEPQLARADSLRILATANDPAWTVAHGAAGDATGELVLHTYADDTFSSFHTPSPAALARFGTLLQPAATETVTVRPLDDWLADTPHASATRVFLKTDTQGHDLAVLHGAPRLRTRSYIVLAEAALVPLYDTAVSPAELAALLAPDGLRPAGSYAVSHDDRDLAALELDCLFTRAPG